MGREARLERSGHGEEALVLPEDGAWVEADGGALRLRSPGGPGVVVELRRRARGGNRRPSGTRRRLVLPGESFQAGSRKVSVPAEPSDLAARGRAVLRAALRGELVPSGPIVVVREGPDAGAFAPLRGGFVCGREPGLALSLADPTLSRRHARLGLQGGRFRIEDLGARNGVRRPGWPARRSLLVDEGGEVRLGGTVLLLLPSASGGTAPGRGSHGDRDARPARAQTSPTSVAALALAAGALAVAALALAAWAVLG